jgi:hypothetical protein
MRLQLDGSPTGDGVVDDQDHYRTDHRYDHTVNVKAGYWFRAEEGEEKAPNYSTDYAENDVENDALARFVDDLARDKAGNQAKNEPSDDGHFGFSLCG